MKVCAGTVMFASDDTDKSVQEARAYIKDNALTSDHVRLIRVDGQVRVVAKIDFELTDQWKRRNK